MPTVYDSRNCMNAQEETKTAAETKASNSEEKKDDDYSIMIPSVWTSF